MKYEYLCGYESDFFTMPANIVAVVRLDHCVQGLTEFSQIAECGKPVVSMRRIIRTPTWSVADQKAGRLPDVGAKCRHRSATDERRIVAVTDNFIGIEVLENEIMPYFITHYEFMQHYKPIETPEEKAARLREEWCIKALSSCSILSGMQKYELKRLGGYIEDIYDALLSGDLPAPGKE